jgi:hypothetical protein
MFKLFMLDCKADAIKKRYIVNELAFLRERMVTKDDIAAIDKRIEPTNATPQQ